MKTITKKEELKILSSMAKRVGMVESDHNRRELLHEILTAIDITIEPPPILPDADQGQWQYSSASCDITSWDCQAKLAKDIKTHADGKVMAGSKDLIEVVVADLRSMGSAYANGGKTKAVLDQLEKMGVVVSELRE